MKQNCIILHYSWSLDHDTLDWLGIIKFHMSHRIDGHIVSKEEFYRRIQSREGKSFVRPWRGPGYHFGEERVKKQTLIFLGRSLLLPGAHCRGMNSKAIGVCVVGRYDDKAPGDDIIEKLCFDLLAPLCLLKNLNPETDIFPHSKFSKTKTCPGKMFPMKKVIAMTKSILLYNY